MSAAKATASRSRDEVEREERAGELHDAIRRLHAIIFAANSIAANAALTTRGVEVTRVLVAQAASLAMEALDLSGALMDSSRASE